MSSSQLSICHVCDTLQYVKKLPKGATVRCVCCQSRLFSNPKGGLEIPLALSLCAIIFFIIANCLPFISLNIQDNLQSSTLLGASLAFLNNGYLVLAFVVMFSTLLAPAVIIFGLNYVLMGLILNKTFPFTRQILHAAHHILPWAMMDVFLLGVIVAMVKLLSLAEVIPGVGLYAFVILILLFSAIIAKWEPHILWEKLDTMDD